MLSEVVPLSLSILKMTFTKIEFSGLKASLEKNNYKKNALTSNIKPPKLNPLIKSKSCWEDPLIC